MIRLFILIIVLFLPTYSNAEPLNADNILNSLSDYFINEVKLTAIPIK